MDEECDMAPILFDVEEATQNNKQSIHPNNIFDPLTYQVFWFDQAYPYNQYAAYEEQLRDRLIGVSFTILNDLTEAICALNTTMANTRFIVIITGHKKKELLRAVHNSVGVETIYVLKLFSKLATNAWSKVTIVPSYSRLVEKLSPLLVSLPTTNYPAFAFTDLHRLDYRLHPDPMLMDEACVRAVSYEVGLQTEQRKSRYKYALAGKLLLDYFRKALVDYAANRDESTIDNPLYNALTAGRHIDSQVTRAETLSTLADLLELGIALDSSSVVWQPWSIAKIAAFFESCGKGASGLKMSFNSLKVSASGLVSALNIRRPFSESERQLMSQLHKELLTFLFKQTQEGVTRPWHVRHLAKMLLADTDLCLKLFLELVFKQDASFRSFADSFAKTTMVSDVRVSTVKEMWERAKFKEDRAYTSQLSQAEMDLGSARCAVSRLIVFELDPTQRCLTTALRDSSKSYAYYAEYISIHEFEVEMHNAGILLNETAYIVVDSTMKQHEFARLLNVCVKTALTPVFVIYTGGYGHHAICKEMLRNTWTVVTVYCETVDQVLDYLQDHEKVLRHEMQYCHHYYENFGRTLSLVRREEKQGSKGPRLSSYDTIERDGGWELLSGIDESVFEHLVDEKVLGSKLTGSLHYTVYGQFKALHKEQLYWENYARLFGVSERLVHMLELTYAKMLLKAYTLQTDPGFYKLLNDAFRTGLPQQIGQYRGFYVSLSTMVARGLLKKYVGPVYRGTHFNPVLLGSLREGMRLYSTCFTSTSKSPYIARAFAAKTHRNVLLEIELHPAAASLPAFGLIAFRDVVALQTVMRCIFGSCEMGPLLRLWSSV